MSKSTDDLNASLRVLEANIALFHDGMRDAYRVVAGELRKLLCDKDPLATRVFESFRPHKLSWNERLEQTPSLAADMQIVSPGQFRPSPTGKGRCELRFASSMQQLELSEWLAQWFFGTDVTIRELIKSVADKEGVHSDPNFNETLLQAKLVKFGTEDFHVPWIVAIGEYILAFVCNEQLVVKAEHAASCPPRK